MAKILVLDDMPDAGHLIRQILEKGGHEVTVFTEEEEALEHIRAQTVDLAILDIKLKKMSGTEVLEALKKIDDSVRVIMLTGYPSLETARESLMLGADEYCIKPIDHDELFEVVADLLAK
jgi:DNA-binding NtrC family response regulator